MEFEIDLIATTKDDGGLLASFERQLEQLGGTSTLLRESTPERVVSGAPSTFGQPESYFEAHRYYRIVL